MHGRVVCLGVALLLLLAILLWDDAPCGCHGVAWADPDLDAEHVAQENRVEPARGLIVTYDNGRTTIPPKISEDAVKRLRGV